MIRARGLQLNAGTRMLLDDVSFELRAGEFVAVLGPNGVGKTTLLRALAGVSAPAFGNITLDGDDVARLRAAQRARAIAYIASDEVFIDQLTVRDVVSTGRYAHHRWWQWREEASDGAAIADALQSVRMEQFTERRFSTLSSGERQRVWLALALAQEAPVLLLDEPTSHLDVRVAHEILALLRALVHSGKTIVCVLHDINEAAQYADRIMLLGSSRMLALESPDELLTSPLLARAYGVAMEIVRADGGQIRVFPRPQGNTTEPSAT